MTKDDNDKIIRMARNAREQSSVATIKAFVNYLEYLNRYNISRVAHAHREQKNNK